MYRPRVASSRFAAGIALAVAALIASGPIGATELYKWTDKNGVVHYSDVPPPKGDETAKRVRLNGTESPNDEPAAEAKPAEPEKTEAGKPPEPAAAALPDTPENRKRLCEQAQSQVDLLQSKFQVADSSGKPLDDKTRAERTVQAKQAASAYCQN
ncbi:MAG: DUF4124 domain-containing protein [Rudaea sp.]|uniref:DUF4124 domain-containing protein n=1 Tax=Rudaea sp. TaxID=2136325 RepID=UPI0039E335A5